MHAVVLRNRAFAGVVCKVALLGAGVQRQDGVGAERPKAHGRNIKNAGAVGLSALRANHDPKIVAGNFCRCDGVVDPLVALGMYIEHGAKGAFVRLAFGALVNQRPLGPRERVALVVAFNEVLANFGANKFEHEAQMPNHGVVAQNGVARLAHIHHALQGQRPKHHRTAQCQQQGTCVRRAQARQAETRTCHKAQHTQAKNGVPRRVNGIQ